MSGRTVLGLGVVFLGYSVFYYGLTQVQGGNWGYLDLVIPARWTDPNVVNTPRDGQTAGGSVSAASKSASSTGGPGVVGQVTNAVKNAVGYVLNPVGTAAKTVGL